MLGNIQLDWVANIKIPDRTRENKGHEQDTEGKVLLKKLQTSLSCP